MAPTLFAAFLTPLVHINVGGEVHSNNSNGRTQNLPVRSGVTSLDQLVVLLNGYADRCCGLLSFSFTKFRYRLDEAIKGQTCEFSHGNLP